MACLATLVESRIWFASRSGSSGFRSTQGNLPEEAYLLDAREHELELQRATQKMQGKICRYAAHDRHESNQYRPENRGGIAPERIRKEHGGHDRHGCKYQFTLADPAQGADVAQSAPQSQMQVYPSGNVACRYDCA